MFSWLWQVQAGAFLNLCIFAWVLGFCVAEDWGLSQRWGQKGGFTYGEVWGYMKAGEYLVDVFVPVALVILTQFLECVLGICEYL